jgi:hypothetical protein
MRTYQEFVSEMTYGRGRGPIGRADRNSGRNRYLGSPTPEQERENKSAADKAAADAVARLRRARAREMKEEVELDEGMTMKDFKANRQKNKRRAASADAVKRGHVGKEWYNSGRKYSPDEAKRMRSKLDDEERRTRHRSAVEPDNENDDNFSADKTKNPKKLRKQKAMGELGEALDKKFDSMRSRGGRSAPPEERSVGGEMNRKSKDYWADTLGKNRDRGKGNKAKRRAAALGEDNVQELFITRKSPEQKADEARKKQVETLIRLMKHAKDPSADVAKTKKEDYDLSETSLTRVMSKSKKGGMAIMSAQRGDKSKAENKERSKQLERDVRGAGLPGPTKVAGRYTENPGTPDEKKVGEKSHIITPGKKGKRKFKKAIEKLGKKYNQDSVLIQRKPGGSSTLKGTSKTSWPGQGKNVKIGSMKPGRTGEFDTKVKNKTFTVEH